MKGPLLPGREMLTFLAVGGAGYLVDVAAFNVLWGSSTFHTLGPVVAKIVAVGLAMIVTYFGNACLTWRGQARTSPRQVALFIGFNLIGLGFSVLTLFVSHDLLGLSSRLDDNISANVLGLALGTAFRYWSYRRFVFDHGTHRVGTKMLPSPEPESPVVPGAFASASMNHSLPSTGPVSTGGNPVSSPTVRPRRDLPLPTDWLW